MAAVGPESASLRVAVVGAGRIGTALAGLWVRGGVDFLGFVGRDRERVARAVAQAGGGHALDYAALRDAACVLLAVPDPVLAAVAARAAADAAPRPDSVWLHASGASDLEVLGALRRHPVHLGSFHPLCPVTDAAAGMRDLPGKPAVLQGDAAALAVMHTLAAHAAMVPVVLPETDRVLYHAACNLAANGPQILLDLTRQILERGCGLAPEQALALPVALLRGGLDACAGQGVEPAVPGHALSGPVRRGDAETLKAHLEHLARALPDALPAYRALMVAAVALASRSGHLSAAARDALHNALDTGPE